MPSQAKEQYESAGKSAESVSVWHWGVYHQQTIVLLLKAAAAATKAASVAGDDAKKKAAAAKVRLHTQRNRVFYAPAAVVG